MFTGIVEELGTVRAAGARRLVVECRTVAEDSPAGASIAVNGVCLTVVENADGAVAFDLSEETLARTALHRLGSGDRVNLERPVTMATRLGGHLARKNDGPPGWLTLWRGWRDLQLMVQGVLALGGG